MCPRRDESLLTHIALLRGINVGGRNMLPMKTLAEVFARAGCSTVRTYIQSGNVVFTAPKRVASLVPRAITEAIAEQFGFDVPLVLRSLRQWRDAVAGNPFLNSSIDAQSMHVAFLAAKPHRSRVAMLDSNRSPGDSFELHGCELYLHLPNGVARTKLTNAYIDSALQTTSTVRNWRTVLKLLELAQAVE